MYTFSSGNKSFYDCSFIKEGHTLWKLRVQRLMLVGFLYVEVVNRSILLVSITTLSYYPPLELSSLTNLKYKTNPY